MERNNVKLSTAGLFMDIPVFKNKNGTVKFWKKNPTCPRWIKKIVSKKQVENLQREKYEG